ncbi:MAG: hypothetical protein GY786_23790 [Proteobacteria bacterium]|nr:hypothetical protein [Pseudomonadota bacterium]
MTENYSQSFKYMFAKSEIDEAIASSLPMLLNSGSICKNEIVELFGVTPLKLANIPFGIEHPIDAESLISQ